MRSIRTNTAVQYRVLAAPVKQLVVVNVDLSALRFVERDTDEIIIEVPLGLHKGAWVSKLFEPNGVLLVRPPHGKSDNSVKNNITGNVTGMAMQVGNVHGGLNMDDVFSEPVVPLSASSSGPIRVIAPIDLPVDTF